MGKDLQGNELGRGFRQRPGGSYNLRRVIKGVRLNITCQDLDKLKRLYNKRRQKILLEARALMQKPSLDDWYNYWCDEYKSIQVKPTTVTIVKSGYRTIFGDYIGTIPINEILCTDLQRCVNQYIAAGKNCTKVKLCVEVFKGLF